MTKRFGIMNSGGAAAGMNATAKAVFDNLNGKDAELIGFKHGWKGLIHNDAMILTKDDFAKDGNISGGHILGSCTKTNVFEYVCPEMGFEESTDCSEICHQTYLSRRLDGIFVLGGDGTSRQANRLAEKYPDMKFYWISATLDRDIIGTDDTIGFHTACENAAGAIISAYYDGLTMNRHMIVECMGRESGLVAIYATALAMVKGVNVDVLLIPELPFDLNALRNRIRMAQKPLLIVIAEGITWDNKQNEKETIDGHHVDLAQTCRKVKGELMRFSSKEIKTMVAGYIQRTGPLSMADVALAENCAKVAVEKAFKEKQSFAVVFKDLSYTTIPLEELVKLNTDVSLEDKRKSLFEDPTVRRVLDQLAAGAVGVIANL